MSTIYSEDFKGHRDIDWAVHVTRNPWGWSEDDQRTARLMVVDAYERMVRLTAGAVVEQPHVCDKLASALDRMRYAEGWNACRAAVMAALKGV